METKIIFLDIDGVLNVIPQGHDKYGAIFHEHFVANLKTIIDETNAKIVISSSWRISGLKRMKKMWEDRNLPGEVIGITDDFSFSPNKTYCRGDEIQEYIDSKDIKSYVILDDDCDMFPDQMYNFVKTSENNDHQDCIDNGFGLTKKCAEKAISILNRNF